MATLLDTINKNLKPETTEGPQLGATAETSRLLRAKSGKAEQPSSGPRQTALGERIAAGQTRAGLEQIGAQQDITQAQQEEQAADIEQRGELQQQAFESKQKLMGDRFNQQAENLLKQYARENKQLETEEDIKNMEQIGFSLRLQNKSYINELQNEGAKARLDDSNKFKEEMMRDVFSDQQNLLSNQLAFDNIMNIDDKAFQVELQKMNANHARQLARDAAAAKSQQDKFAAGASIITTAAKAGLKHGLDSGEGSTKPSGSMFDDPSGDVRNRPSTSEWDASQGTEFK